MEEKSTSDIATRVTDVEAKFKRPVTPTYPTQRKKRKVLSEDKFAEALESIIQRECFPDLEKLKAQNAYLDAVANNDIQMMRELHSKYGSGKNTPSLAGANETPTTFETPTGLSLSLNPKLGPDQTPSSIFQDSAEQTCNDDAHSVTSEASTTASRGPKKPQDMTLNEFLNTYTSEDNQSFQEIIDEGIRKHKMKHAFLYNEEDRHNERLQERLKLPSAEEQQSLEYQRPNYVETWKYVNKNAVMYIPDGVPYTGKELTELAKKKPEVTFKNTRFSATPFKPEVVDPNEPQTPSVKALSLLRGFTVGKVGVDGKEMDTKTPSVNGFSYVRTPSPNPGVEDTPFLTWGEIEGTPFRLDASDTPVPRRIGTPYRMIETSQRERLAFELAEKASQRYRDKKQKTLEVAKSYLSTPSPRPRPKTSVERMSTMSPAAQRFAKNILKRTEPGTPSTPR